MAAREGERFWRGTSDAQKADGAEFWQELMRERRRRQAESAQESACEPERETVPVEWIAHDVLLKVRNGLAESAAADLEEHFETYDLQDRMRRRTEHLTAVRLAFEAEVDCGWPDQSEWDAADEKERDADTDAENKAEWDADLDGAESETEWNAESAAEFDAAMNGAEMDAVLVQNLPYHTTSGRMVTGIFEQVGEVLSVEMDADENELWAYVRFARPQDAEDAVRSFDGAVFQGEFMEVTLHAWIAPDLD